MLRMKTKFNSERKPLITSVTLGGFQVFEETTTIPLGKLTFLFGPNSAGKSAIEDGLDFLLRLVKKGSLSFEDKEDLEENWRRVTDGYSPFLSLGLTASTDVNLRACLILPNVDEGSDYYLPHHEISVAVRFKYDEKYDEFGTTTFFQVTIDGIPILELEECASIGVNFGHPLLDGYILNCDYDFLARNVPKFVRCDEGWVRVEAVSVWMDQKVTDSENLLWGFEHSDKYDDPPSEHNQNYGERLRAAVIELTKFFHEIKDVALRNITAAFNSVPASRTIPSRKDLTFLLQEGDHLLSQDYGFPKGDTRYRNLAASCLKKRLGVSTPIAGPDLVDSVNRALSDHLFLDRGYQVSADFRALLPLEDVESHLALSAEDLTEKPFLIHVFLKDSRGRIQAFDQVGSGLGYVLPVLCSIADPSVKISLIQQPELH